jgi:hypothetical protein
MKRAVFLIAAACAAMTASAVGQSISDMATFTARMLNGYGWLQLSDNDRATYLIGLVNGEKLACDYGAKIDICQELDALHGISFVELARQVSSVYETRANLKVPASVIYRVVVRRIEGAETERMLSDARKTYSR